MSDPVRSMVEAYADRRLVLFAGAGVSTGLNLPSWRGLIEHLASGLGYDTEVFLSMEDYAPLADYYAQTDPDLRLLCDWMDREWHGPSIDVAGSALHRDIALARFPIIYTTNYDWWLEKAHEKYGVPYQRVVTGADISALSGAATEIVKFHGDLETRQRMVVTETHYLERLRIDSELDIKLRSDMLRYSLLFVGYSLRDVNVRAMLHRLSLFRRGVATPDVRSYVVMDRRNEVQAALLRRWNVEPLYVRDLDVGTGVGDFMAQLRSGTVTAVEPAP